MISLLVTGTSSADALYQSLDTHPSVQSQYAKHKVSVSKIKEAEVSWFPNISVTTKLYRSRTTFNSTKSLDNKGGISLDGSLTIWEGYGLNDRIDRSRLDATIAALAIRNVKMSLWGRLSASKPTYVFNTKLEIAQSKALNRLNQALREVDKRIADGNAIEIDRITVVDAIDSMQRQLLQTRYDLEKAEATFNQLSAGQSIQDTIQQPKGSLKDLLQVAHQHNSEFIRKRMLTMVTEDDRRKLRAARLPKLELYTTLSREGSKYEDSGWSNYSSSAELGLKVVIPFSFDPRISAQIKTSQLQTNADLIEAEAQSRGMQDSLADYVATKDSAQRYIDQLNPLLSKAINRFSRELQSYKSGEENTSVGDVLSSVSEILGIYRNILTARREVENKTITAWVYIGKAP